MGHWIIATGPLTSGNLAEAIRAETGEDALAFFDAIAPIVYAESINMDVAWMQSRYDKGETEEERTAYLNCPMTKDQYEAFIDALAGRRQDRIPRGRNRRLFRRLPAHRSHGRTRPRDTALWSDEAGRTDQRA